MNAELRARILAYNKEHADAVTENTALREQIASHTETMRTIANLFSNSVWKVLPNSIKQYFTQYRE